MDWGLATLFGLLGLLVGSFLNVLIHRLPIMLEREWAQADTTATEYAQHDAFNLMTPRSSCPHCGTPIKWFHNIPLLSYVALQGKCAHCGTRVSLQYPLVEALTALLFAACAHFFDWPFAALAWSGFCAVLLAAALIDWKTTYLPDLLTLPLMWAGILCALLGWIQLPLAQSVWGAIIGYSTLWTIYWVFKLLTGKDGMGYGDFKLLAALGAWMGPIALIPILLISCTMGSVFGLLQRLRGTLLAGQAFAFGPFLAAAGFSMCFWGRSIVVFLGLTV